MKKSKHWHGIKKMCAIDMKMQGTKAELHEIVTGAGSASAHKYGLKL